MKRVAVIGASGLLGGYLVEEAVGRGHKVLGTYKESEVKDPKAEIRHLDTTDAEETDKVLSSFEPEIVILSSALTNIDYCESHPQEAWSVNVDGTMNVAVTCNKIGARLMFISTDAVFNGEKGSKYYEFETPDPMTIYAKTKLEGERLTLDASHRNSVCRVSVLYGWNKWSGKKNFATWVIGSLRKGEELRLFEDQFMSPTYAPHCAEVLITMAEQVATGSFHVSGPDCIDRFSMGMKIAETFGLDGTLIKRARSENIPWSEKRGRYLCLDVQKAEAEFGVSMLPVSQGLERMKGSEKR